MSVDFSRLLEKLMQGLRITQKGARTSFVLDFLNMWARWGHNVWPWYLSSSPVPVFLLCQVKNHNSSHDHINIYTQYESYKKHWNDIL